MRADRLLSLVLLGLVNKAGTWYLVAAAEIREPGQAADIRGDRAGRISGAFVTAERFQRPADFELARFWARWSAEFAASRPRLQVTLRASPEACRSCRRRRSGTSCWPGPRDPPPLRR